MPVHPLPIIATFFLSCIFYDRRKLFGKVIQMSEASFQVKGEADTGNALNSRAIKSQLCIIEKPILGPL